MPDPNQSVAFTIIGQGLAGSVLSMQLIKAGYRVAVYDEAKPGRSSVVAPGLFTPISGSRLAQPWGAPAVHEVAANFYQELERETGSSFYHPMRSVRVLDTPEERATWEVRRHKPEFARWVAETLERVPELPSDPPHHGGLLFRNAGWVDLPAFLNAVRAWLQGQGAWLVDPPNAPEDQADRTIYCTGHRWPSGFGFLPLRPCKGDVLLVRCPNPLPPRILQRGGIYLLPMPGDDAHIGKVGGVFHREFDGPEPSSAHREELLAGLRKLVDGEVEVLEHHSGIRPSTTHFRPIAGFLPDDPKRGVFNSLGSKGVLFAPLAARQFVDWLKNGTPMDSQVDLQTYVAKYGERTGAEGDT